MKILKYIFCILLFICLFIWAGCTVDPSSNMKRQEIQYRLNNYRSGIIVDKYHDQDLLFDNWYISIKYDGTVKVIEVTRETYMSCQIGDTVSINILTGEKK